MGPVDHELAAEFEPIRDSQETILWAGKPHHVPFLASAVPVLGFGALWGCFDLFFLVAAQHGKANNHVGLFLYPFLALHSFPAWGSLLYFVWLALSYKNTAYAITTRRVILRSGVWAANFQSFDMDQISEADVTIGPIEKMIGCGTVRANAGRTNSKGLSVFESMVAIDDPYAVYKLLKETAVNIKTDWNYPNKLRPADNPGYRTEYKPEP
jgi:hypothetical protein